MPEGAHSSSCDVPMGEESPRLSTASISSNEFAPSATPSDGSDLPSSGQRPISLISTLSSGSASSRDDCQVLPSNSGPTTESIGSDVSPPGDTGKQTQTHPDMEDPAMEGRHLGSGHFLQQNNNNAAGHSQQVHASPFKAKTKKMAPNPQLTYLDRVIMEIIETERTYVRDLRMIVEDYLAHIIDQADLSIRPEQVCALFGNIEDIYEFNSELLQTLDRCDNDPVAVARCFVMKSEYFEIYTQYCTNYPNSVAALTECMRNKSLAKFFRERQASLKCSLPLGSFLLKPVQRILKYHLLLQEIAKHFDPEEEGYEVVEEAIYTMTGVAWYINDMKRKHEHAVRLQEVQSLLLNWKGPDLTTYGELVLEGTFKVHRAKNERTLFLFERMLLITKRRGEHFVYKTHISCSTLMLIESAKDSLCFSVTHYKHPKQPHTVQARTVDERKLWAHHIKRIILENHHAIIPQKAKEAILEMDSIYPSKYRYSPERLKKALSSQSDQFLRGGRQGRRQSEPTKQILKNSKAILKHADSDGTLPEDTCPLQPTSSHSTPSATLAQSDTKRPGVGEEEEEEEKNSLEVLADSEEEERQECPLQESDTDEMVMEGDQVADFAASMLAAISCWHYRATALLSMRGVMTDEMGGDVAEENRQVLSQGQEPESQGEEHESQGEEHGSPPQDEQEKTSDSAPHSSPPPHWGFISRPGVEAPSPGRESDNTEEQAPATPESDSKPLTSGESSEEEEDEEREEADKGHEDHSILPSSVLDKASAIAQHFSSSTRRSSLANEDSRSLGCPSPCLPSRSGSILSLGAEPSDRPLPLNSNSSENQENFIRRDLTLLSPGEDKVFDGDGRSCRRRDSTLSKQDQLLIGKIKSYYESAENQDASFCLRRRESLTYIPSGLVRSSVSRLNNIPKDKTPAEEKHVNCPSIPNSFTTEPDSSLAAPPQGHVVSSSPLEFLESTRKKEEPGFSVEESLNMGNLKDKPIEDEEFRPSSEMIKVWQAMEREMNRLQDKRRGCEKHQEAQRTSRTAPSPSSRTTPGLSYTDKAGGESELSTIMEESTKQSPPKAKYPGLNRAGSLKDTLKLWGEEVATWRPPVPRVVQLRAEAEPAEDSDQTKSKVLHLARQYSQRIRTSRATVRQRHPDLLMDGRNLPSVMEEESCSGKSSLSLPLSSNHNVSSSQLSPVENLQSLSLAPPSSPHPISLAQHSRSPLSPPPMEGFHWPDVRELRSKYISSDSQQSHPISRSRSVPERMLDGSSKRRSSCSSRLFLSEGGPVAPPPYRTHLGRDNGQGESRMRLHRANSLDHRLSSLHLNQLQSLQDPVPHSGLDSYYISAEASLAEDSSHKIIVMEKLPEQKPEPAKMAKEAEEEEEAQNYVQIRSPTSREKISIMAVIDRCRAYQDSEEYKQRQEGGIKTEPVLLGGWSKELDRGGGVSNEQHDEVQKSNANQEVAQQSLVKNLREKFQNLQ
ncbi:pleckstrin homology domain-containing family G member 3 [Lampris incognitus]|uniref:pleckstrin homology domain-containing family G member 3 n=1 Tax=Lampris incognitus TaxID=2546036 RepID=UPI0024B51B6C|nr:pleckstrin homology domain-containing family G member 3 [Lampris incognitus]